MIVVSFKRESVKMNKKFKKLRKNGKQFSQKNSIRLSLEDDFHFGTNDTFIIIFLYKYLIWGIFSIEI